MNQMIKIMLLATASVTITRIEALWDGVTVPLTSIDGLPVPPLDVLPPVNQPWFSKYNLAGVPVLPQTSNKTGTAAPIYANPDILACKKPTDWAISYDDGPSQYTEGVLSNLTAAKEKVTFFVVGSRIIERPDLLLKTYQLGHQIACHTWSHPYLTSISNDEIIAEMEWCVKAVSYVTGVKPRYMRPPFGDEDARVRGVLVAMGFEIVIWNIDSTDYLSGPVTDGALSNPSYDQKWIVGNITSFINERKGQQVPPAQGVISLEHDLYYTSSQEAPNVLKAVKAANYTILPVGTCMGDSKWYSNQATMTATHTTMATATKHATTIAPAKLATMRPATLATRTPGSSATESQGSGVDVITPIFSIYFIMILTILSIYTLVA
ncbi:hypothetical protein SeMB42_g03386 [Synchytrium endobioticum]|uniref:NodB homology domain-containing protein n=1 Tax=Synchytrium endobioticum TaxID=286115 RepID=A0A507CUC4_9FUNG|nr:hypothetical protein SeLEV6574_g05409 [Synchytrium endobioticum]TPX47284.1 hypothetical protein SeMB42_g03386 [Synchytrium endobioticum]